MVAIRDNGFDITLKDGYAALTPSQGERLTIFAVSADTSAHPFLVGKPSPLQIWAMDSSGNKHELSNDFLEALTLELSGKTQFVYDVITEFLSGGFVHIFRPDQQITGSLSVSGNFGVTNLITGAQVFTPSATADQLVVTQLLSANRIHFNNLENDKFASIVPFYVKSSMYSSPYAQTYRDPAILSVNNKTLYADVALDRCLHFTVLDRRSLSVVFDSRYDTAGSQSEPPQLAYDMFKYMNKNTIGVLNSKELWENLIGRQETAESYGLSAVSISAAYSSLSIGSLYDQFKRFGLNKAIQAVNASNSLSISSVGSQYCAVFEGYSVYTSGTSAYDFSQVPKAVEVYLPARYSGYDKDLQEAINNEGLRAELSGWFVQPISAGLFQDLVHYTINATGNDVNSEEEMTVPLAQFDISHGLMRIGSLVRAVSAGLWTCSSPESLTNARVDGWVEDIQSSTFNIKLGGIVHKNAGFIGGIDYFLAERGNYSASVPVTAGTYSRKVLQGLDNSTAIFVNHDTSIVKELSGANLFYDNVTVQTSGGSMLAINPFIGSITFTGINQIRQIPNNSNYESTYFISSGFANPIPTLPTTPSDGHRIAIALPIGTTGTVAGGTHTIQNGGSSVATIAVNPGVSQFMYSGIFNTWLKF